jgi:hypothetical protein
MFLQRGYIILIAAAVLFVSGIVISALWAGSFAGTFLRESTIIGQTLIKPSESVNASLQVNDIARPIAVAVHFKPMMTTTTTTTTSPSPQSSLSSSSSTTTNLTLSQTVRDPAGLVVSRNTFVKEFFTAFKPQTTGKYTLTLTNLGRQSVNVDGVFGYIPFINQNNQVNINSLSGIIAGIILVTIAIITLIVGIIVVIIDRRRKGKQPPSPIATR